jgi:hypothetical protein
MILTGENQRTRKRACPSVALLTINPTWTALGMNLAFCSEKLVTNCLSYGMAFIHHNLDEQ